MPFPKQTRRELLGTAAVAAVAARCGTSSEPAPPPIVERTGDGVLRIAVVGVRRRGVGHVFRWSSIEGVEVAALVDVDRREAENGLEYATAPISSDLRTVLEDPAIDIVSIASPNHWHVLQALWSLRADKHVYVEKPMSHNVVEGRRLVDEAAQSGRVVQVGHQARSYAAAREAIAYLHSGALGPVRRIRCVLKKVRESIGTGPIVPVPPAVDYDRWLGPAPERPFREHLFHYNWHWLWSQGDGELGNTGSHQFDLATWGAKIETHPRRVQAVGGRLGYADDGQTPNTLFVRYEYDDLEMIYDLRNLVAPEDERGGLIFECEGGRLDLRTFSLAEAYDETGALIRTFEGGEDVAHFVAMADAVDTGTPPACRAIDGHRSSTLVHLGNISLRTGEPTPVSAVPDLTEDFPDFRAHLTELGVTEVTLGPTLEFDPDAERFVGDDDANALLTNAYRSPYTL